MKLKITMILCLILGTFGQTKADFFGKNPIWNSAESIFGPPTYCKISGWEVTKFSKYIMHTQKNCRCVTDYPGQYGLERSKEFDGAPYYRFAFIQDTNDLNKIYDSNKVSPRLLMDFNLKKGDTSRFYVEVTKDSVKGHPRTNGFITFKVLYAKDTIIIGQKLKYQKLEITDSFIAKNPKNNGNMKTIEIIEKLGFLNYNKLTFDINTFFDYYFHVESRGYIFTQYCDDDSLKYPNQHASAAQCLTFPTEIETPEQLSKKLTVKYFSQNHSIYFGDLSDNKYTIQLFDLNGRKISFTYESNNIINIDPNIHNSLILCQISYKGSPLLTRKLLVN